MGGKLDRMSRSVADYFSMFANAYHNSTRHIQNAHDVIAASDHAQSGQWVHGILQTYTETGNLTDTYTKLVMLDHKAYVVSVSNRFRSGVGYGDTGSSTFGMTIVDLSTATSLRFDEDWNVASTGDGAATRAILGAIVLEAACPVVTQKTVYWEQGVDVGYRSGSYAIDICSDNK